MDSFEYKGYWFLPNDPDNAVAGILKYIPNDSIELELLGSLENDNSNLSIFNDKTKQDIIWGMTSDAQKITLINCFSAGSSMNFACTFPITRYMIEYCLNGIHIDSYNDAKFSWCDVEIPSLSMWCYPSALEQSYANDDDNNIIINISFKQKDVKILISKVYIKEIKTSLMLKAKVYYNESKYNLNPIISQSTLLQIHKDFKSKKSNYLSDILLFEDFLSLTALSTIKVSKVILFDEDNYQELENNVKVYKPIELYYINRGQTLNFNDKYNFLFKFNDIKDIYPEIIEKWYLGKYNIGPIRTHLIKSVEKKRSFDSTDFLIIIQAIDGFYIRFRKEKDVKKIIPFKVKLNSIINEFSDIDKINKLDIDTKAAVDSRNYYSHFMNKSDKPHTLDGVELYELSKKLQVLLICCLLNFIGFDNERINEILNQSQL